jgi:multimeric flavodoxin WrbA
MRALVLNCTLKPSPETSNTEALARVVMEALEGDGVEAELVRRRPRRQARRELRRGPPRRLAGDPRKVLGSEVLIVAAPTWLGRPSSIAQRVLERLDAMLSEQDDQGRPVAHNRVAGVVVTGNEDGAHHVISEIAGALIDVGFAIPGQAWTYWNKGPGPGPSYLEASAGREWSHSTGRAMASNLAAAGRALAAKPIPTPPSWPDPGSVLALRSHGDPNADASAARYRMHAIRRSTSSPE